MTVPTAFLYATGTNIPTDHAFSNRPNTCNGDKTTATFYDNNTPRSYGSKLRQDYLIGNHMLRAIYGFTNLDDEIGFTVYLMCEPGKNDPDFPAKGAFRLCFTKDGQAIAFPGRISSLKSVKTLAMASEVEISAMARGIGDVELTSWIAEDNRTIYFEITAKDTRDVELRLESAFEDSKSVDRKGIPISPGAPIPSVAAGKWEFALTWDETPTWVEKIDIIERHNAVTDRTRIYLDNTALADRTNALAPILSACIRKDGRLSAGAHRAYNGAWIRDGVMDSMGMLYAGSDDTWNVLSYLLSNVPPKKGQIEENGMLIFGFYQYWLATGSDKVKSVLPTLMPFVWDLFRPECYDNATGLLISSTEGYWERHWLGSACEFSQNLWAVIAARSYIELAKNLGFEDDFDTLDAKADALMKNIPRFIVDGRFVKRLLPGGEVQWKGTVIRGCSLGENTYHGQFAKPEDHKETKAELDPDVQTCVSWLWGLASPDDPVCKKTADEIWKLYDQDWSGGGLSRYNVFSDPDRETAGPWFLASLMMARAYALQQDWKRVGQIIDWADREFLGCGWSERISRCHPSDDPDRYIHEILNWPAGEWLMLVFREGAGLYPTEQGLSIVPHLPKELSGLQIENFKYRGHLYDIAYHGVGCKIERIEFDGKVISSNILPAKNGKVNVYLTSSKKL